MRSRSVLAGTSAVLGIVPSGSGNGLARELGIPRDSRAALAAAIAGAPRRIDAGRIDSRRFFSVAGIGFDAHVAAAFDRRRGDAACLNRTSASPRVSCCDIVPRPIASMARLLATPFLVTVQAPRSSATGIRIAPGALVDDGALDLVVFEERSRLSTVFDLPRLLTGSVARARGVRMERVTRPSSSRAIDPIQYHVDGEPHVGGTRIEADGGAGGVARRGETLREKGRALSLE
ncbi:MAG: diacylglycerol kinase family protein [Vicinamibacterales bacterium]